MRRISAVLPKCLLVLGICAMFVGVGWSADKDKDDSDIAKRIDASAKVLDEIMATPDKAIPDKVMRDAKCIAVIPSMVKIAVGFGGNHGKGVATCRTASGWSAPAPITITGGSWGLQLGGQAVDLVMIVTNDQGMQHLLSSKFKLGADASAAAGPVGRDAAADTDVKMRAEVLTYSRARGLFAGIDLKVEHRSPRTKTRRGCCAEASCPFQTFWAAKVQATASSAPFLNRREEVFLSEQGNRARTKLRRLPLRRPIRRSLAMLKRARPGLRPGRHYNPKSANSLPHLKET